MRGCDGKQADTLGGDHAYGCRPLFAFYEAGQEVGRSEARVQVIEKQVEVIRYVEKKKAEIHARPNAGRDDLLKLMRAGKL